MRKSHEYIFRKVYLSDKIFEDSSKELKIGYLNIQNLTAELHCEYVNSDKNLNNLDILVLAETWLISKSDDKILDNLSNFHILYRYDAGDSIKHCGLLILGSKQSKFNLKESTVKEYKESKRNKTHMQILTLILPTLQISAVFIYIRETPSKKDIETILKYCNDCDIWFGDLNLNPREPAQKKLLSVLCGKDKFLALEEVTTDNFNQLDHIIVNKILKPRLYTTSYFNFISNHNSITARIGLADNSFTAEFLKKISCTRASNISTEKDIKSSQPHKTSEENQSLPASTSSSHCSKKRKKSMTNDDKNKKRRSTKKKQVSSNQHHEQSQFARTCHGILHRRMHNQDKSSCWLNCCLQLILVGIDRVFEKKGQDMFRTWGSKLGNILIEYRNKAFGETLDTSKVRQELVKADRNNTLNLQFGQQDSRDFFVALANCVGVFSDVYYFLNIPTYVSTTCQTCKTTHWQQNISEELFREIKCPPNGSNLKEAMIKTFMVGENVNYRCEKCNCERNAINCSQIYDVSTAEFLTVILQRTISIDGHNTIVRSQVVATDTVILKDSKGVRAEYEPIAVIQHEGIINRQGQTSGHYIADVKNQRLHQWFRTSDNDIPVAITENEVSRTGYIILYARVDSLNRFDQTGSATTDETESANTQNNSNSCNTNSEGLTESNIVDAQHVPNGSEKILHKVDLDFVKKDQDLVNCIKIFREESINFKGNAYEPFLSIARLYDYPNVADFLIIDGKVENRDLDIFSFTHGDDNNRFFNACIAKGFQVPGTCIIPSGDLREANQKRREERQHFEENPFIYENNPGCKLNSDSD